MSDGLFPIKVKEVTMTSEEYESMVVYVKQLEDINETHTKFLKKLETIGVKIDPFALNSKDIRMYINDMDRTVTIEGR